MYPSENHFKKLLVPHNIFFNFSKVKKLDSCGEKLNLNYVKNFITVITIMIIPINSLFNGRAKQNFL